MAYCRLGHIKENKGAGGAALGLKNCIEYIFNPKKTENQTLIGGYNVLIDKNDTVSSAYRQLLQTKGIFGKYDGRQGYHYKFSFAKDDKVSPELAMKITDEFCRRAFWGYECCYSVHTNTEHLHSHIVFNSVSLDTGMKYHYKKGDWANIIQPIANDLCREYGLSEINLNLDEELRLTHKCKNYGKWMKEENKLQKPLHYTNKMIRQDVDEAIKQADSYEDFLSLLQAKGHTLDDSGKHLTILAPGRSRPCRSYVLSEDKSTYTRENIKRMINGSFLSREEIEKRLFAGWRVYLVECSRVRIKGVRFSPEFAKAMEDRRFIAEHDIHDKEALDFYRYQLNACDKQLNIMRKYLCESIAAQEDNVCMMNELLGLMRDYQAYTKYQTPIYRNSYNRANELYRKLSEKGISLEELFVFDKRSKRLLDDLDAYKKHIYVEKKICDRLESSNLIQKGETKSTKKT